MDRGVLARRIGGGGQHGAGLFSGAHAHEKDLCEARFHVEHVDLMVHRAPTR